MKRFVVGGLTMMGVAAVLALGWGRAGGQGIPGGPETNPGPAGAKLNVPWMEAAPSSPKHSLPLFARENPGAASPSPPGGNPQVPGTLEPFPNQDIMVTPSQGPWMILVNWYSGPGGHVMARKMVMELRAHYHLPAFAFNKGGEEKRRQKALIQEKIQETRELYRKQGLELPKNFPIRISHLRIEDQWAVLVGNYATIEKARRALNEVRKLPPPDPRRVDLATMFVGSDFDQSTGKFKKFDKGQHVWVNPFLQAFVVPNPLAKVEKPAERDKMDIVLLKKLNTAEPYSLFQCPKPFTLAVKQFLLPSTLQSRSGSSSFLESLGLGGKSKMDTAAENAHNLAGLFRKTGLEGYVLHTKFSSIVTVGAFTDPGDPALKSTQSILINQLKIPNALPMQVPR